MFRGGFKKTTKEVLVQCQRSNPELQCTMGKLRTTALLLLIAHSTLAAPHHGNECEHKDDHTHAPQQAKVAQHSNDAQAVNSYPESARQNPLQAPAAYYIEHRPVLVPIQAVQPLIPYVRYQRQFGGASNIPVSGGPIAVQPLRPPTQPLVRPPTQQLRPFPQQRPSFGGAANIPVSGGPFPLFQRPGRDGEIRQVAEQVYETVAAETVPLQDIPQVEDPAASFSAAAPPKKAEAAALGPFPLNPPSWVNKPQVEAAFEDAVKDVPQVEDPDAGFAAAAPPKKAEAVVLGPIPVNRPSWVNKPQVEAPFEDTNVPEEVSVAEYAFGNDGDFPKTKPFPVAGTDIGQPKPVLGESVKEFPKTKPFPVPGSNIGQPKPVGEGLPAVSDGEISERKAPIDFPKTKPFPVPGTGIGQPQPVLGSLQPAIAPVKEFPKTKPFPVPGSNIGQPKPVGEGLPTVLDSEVSERRAPLDFPKTKPFPVQGTGIGQPQPVGDGIPVGRPQTKPFPVAGTNIGQPRPVGAAALEDSSAVNFDGPKTKPFPVAGSGIGNPQLVVPAADADSIARSDLSSGPKTSEDCQQH